LQAATIDSAMLLYYITDRRQFEGGEGDRLNALLRRIGEASSAGVDYVQLREKDLCARELESLARATVQAVRDNSNRTRLLINGRTDVALACDADGVHLPDGDLAASEVRTLWMKSTTRLPLIGVSAHSADAVRYAEGHGADFAVLAPIFEKHGSAAIGVAALQEACSGLAPPGDVEAPYQVGFRVLALGGVTLNNARDCVAARAAGVAGIRLFQSGDVFETVRRLRG
jgi:thiamine-phosphate pyrophosphorylase